MKNDHTFVYAIHIATTPEKLWEALTSNAFWQKYWNGEWRIESDWKVGSPLRFYTRDGKPFSTGEVLASDPPRTLTYTWPNPEEEESAPEHLTWEIESSGPGTVLLKLTHGRLSEKYHKLVPPGWAMILSSLKTLLETGKPLAFNPRE